MIACAFMVLLAAGCGTPTHRGAAEKKAAGEVDRICSLPKPERDAELRKLESESGVVLYCGDAK